MNKPGNPRYQEKACANCRFYRIHTTGATVSECLMLGRTIGMVPPDAAYQQLLDAWAWGHLCDFWSRRPRNWDIYSTGADSNPHWKDPYYSRERIQRMKKRSGIRD